MAITFAQAQTIITNNLGESDSDTTTWVGQCLNQAQKDVARAHPWPALTKRAFFNTVIPYTTGTVAVTNASATVTGTATVFPSAVATAAYRFALSAGSQWYTVSVRGGDTSLTLAQNYVGATSSSTTYALYKAVYDLATDVGKLESITLHNGASAIPLTKQPSESWTTQFGYFPSGFGVPTSYTTVERDSAGSVQVMLGPLAPDAVYRCEYVYKKRITEDSFVLDDDLTDLIILRAQALAYERDHFQRHLAKMREYETQLVREIKASGDTVTSSVIVGLGRSAGHGTYLERLMDYGDVASS